MISIRQTFRLQLSLSGPSGHLPRKTGEGRKLSVGAICTALVGTGSDPALAAGLILVSAGVIGQIAFWIALRYRAPAIRSP